jgi:hypothetical protein
MNFQKQREKTQIMMLAGSLPLKWQVLLTATQDHCGITTDLKHTRVIRRVSMEDIKNTNSRYT